MEEQNIDMEKVEELFERVPQVFRKTAVDFANNIISNQNLNEEEKKEALQNLIKKVTSVVAYVATIERNLKNIREGFNDYLSIAKISSIEGENSGINEFIQDTQMFLVNSDEEIANIIKELDVERAKEIIEETNLKSSVLNTYMPYVKKTNKKIKKPSQESKSDKRWRLNPKIKKLIAGLGLGSIVALYTGPGIGNAVKESKMLEDYQVGETVEKIDENTLAQICMQLNDEKSVTGTEVGDFKNYITQIANDMDTFIKYEQKLKKEPNEVSAEDRFKYHESAAKILSHSELQPMLQNLIKSKLAISINESQKINVSIKDITLGRHEAENEKEEYNYITYKNPNTNETIVNKETLFYIGLFDKDTNGRMQAEFVDIVDIYRKLNDTNLNEEELAECYKSVMSFLGEREIKVSRDGRISMKNEGEIEENKTDEKISLNLDEER